MKKIITKISLIIAISCPFSFSASANADTILVRDNSFTPNVLAICLGDTIRFVYDTGVVNTHNVHITNPIDSTSADLTTAGDVVEFVATSPNTYFYQCDYYTGMQGYFTVNNLPSVNLGSDVTQCGGTIVFDAGNSGSTYLWSNGAIAQTDTVSSSGTYYVDVTDVNGCSASDTIMGTIFSLPVVNLGADVTQCGGTLLDADNAGSFFLWSTGATTQTVTVTSSGNYSVTVTDTNGCSASDAITVSADGKNPPLVEGIELAAFPPAGWTINNPDNSLTWSKTTVAYKSGTKSMFMDYHSYPAVGEIDEITSPALDLSGGSSPATLTFYVAYQLYTNPSNNPNFSDTLRVQVSTDCGVTWNTLYNKYGTALTTVTPAYSTSPFVPTASQWRMDTVSLPMAAQLMVKFIGINGYGNQLYIDDININNGVGVNDIVLDDYVSVFPNPSSGSVFVNVNTFNLGDVDMKLYNIVGEVISETTDNISVPTKFNFDLSNQPSGIYFIEVNSENNKIVKKIILTK